VICISKCIRQSRGVYLRFEGAVVALAQEKGEESPVTKPRQAVVLRWAGAVAGGLIVGNYEGGRHQRLRWRWFGGGGGGGGLRSSRDCGLDLGDWGNTGTSLIAPGAIWSINVYSTGAFRSYRASLKPLFRQRKPWLPPVFWYRRVVPWHSHLHAAR
jgi:hypothetical protein